MAHPVIPHFFFWTKYYTIFPSCWSTSSSVLASPPCCGSFLNLDEDKLLLFQNTLNLQRDYFCINKTVQVVFSNKCVRIFILKFPQNHQHAIAKEHAQDIAFLRCLRYRADIAFLYNKESSPL
jgi:hypothetical protein